MKPRPVEILLVEDNPGDVDLTKESLHEWKILNNLHVVEDGVEAIAFLRGQGKYEHAPRPDLIFLDLNLPKKDGREVLGEIKSDRYFKTIPVVILSTSDADMDIVKTYGLGANCYIVKPIGIENFMNVLRSVGEFWFTIVKLPSIELLRQYRQSLSAVTQETTISARPKNHIRVLVVDDNPADSDFVKEVLSEQKKPSFHTATCDRLETAMEMLRRSEFDVVLLDLGLPDSQGIETYNKLAFKFPHVAIIINTDRDDNELALNAIYAGAQDYIIKSDLEGRLVSRIIQYAIERKWLDEERNSIIAKEQVARAEAEAAILARDEFLGIASHELRTPITSLRLQSQLITRVFRSGKEQEIITKGQRLAKTFDKQTDRLAALVENLLDISRINAGRLLLDFAPVDLNEVVQDLLERFEEQLKKAKCEVLFQQVPGLIGSWDRFRIEQVVTNLLTNAMKYGAGKPIEIRVEKTDTMARLVVEDHGIGIKKKDLPRIFGRFERIVRPGQFSGLGLGLYIVRQIVNAHHGKIYVESEFGKGSKFIVELHLKA